MITGHENRTFELTDFELSNLLPVVIKSWSRKLVGELVSTTKMVDGCNDYFHRNNILNSKGNKVYKTSGVRVRKAIHHIRVNDLLPHPLVANSKGYFLTDNQVEIKKFIKSLRERANSFTQVADAMSSKNL